MKTINLLDISLDLFDGGAAGAAAGDGAAAPAGAQEGDGARAGSQAVPGRSRRGKSGGETMVYGKQAVAEAPQEGPDAEGQKQEEKFAEKPKDRYAKYRELVEGEFKDLYTEDTQRIIDRRFRDVKSLEESLEAQRPVLDLLMERYRIEDGDVSKLVKAIEQDESQWKEAADKVGMTVEQYRNYRQLQRENENFRRAQEEQRGQQLARQQMARWMQESEDVKADYPDFSMETEIQRPEFMAMLKTGVPVRHAYEVLHLDDIKGGVARNTAAQTEKLVTENIRAKGARPQENGVSSQNGITIKADPSKLSKRDRAEIARRVARGEKIIF